VNYVRNISLSGIVSVLEDSNKRKELISRLCLNFHSKETVTQKLFVLAISSYLQIHKDVYITFLMDHHI